MIPTLRTALLIACAAIAAAQTRTASVTLSFGRSLGPMNIDRFALGQGGLSENPMWEDRAAEIRALHPRLIRLFVQEYFDLLPEPGRYHFDSLDRSVDLILRTGATPLMSLAFKPRALFPVVDQDVVEPADYEKWEDLIFQLVRHYKDRGAGIRYWEVGNEPDIGEDGGCPYRFKPQNYVRYYQHTAAAIRRADPEAKVGGPALAGWKSPILPALLEWAAGSNVPLDFVSWHIYSSSPKEIRGTVEGVQKLVARYPSLRPEKILDEWNMSLGNPSLDPRFQPCFVAEVAWQMKDAGLDYSCYYHIRDYAVDRDRFAKFFSPQGASFMARWWNRMPQYDGLFDFQNTVRPAYFTFKLLSRLGGERLAAESSDPAVHAFLTHDPGYYVHNFLVWNYSAQAVKVKVEARDLPSDFVAKRRRMDAAAASNDENVRLRQLDDLALRRNSPVVEIELEPYGMEFWSIEDGR
jgi:hypothetical protein